MTKEEESKIRDRIAWLDLWIGSSPHWGAALGAMDEERRGLLAKLEAVDHDR